MGLFGDSVEASHGGHHFAVRTVNLTWEGYGLGVVSTLYVDGRRCARRVVFPWQRAALAGLVEDDVVIAEVNQHLLSTTYRLFVGDLEVPLHVEPGCSSVSIHLPPPMLASFSRAQLGP